MTSSFALCVSCQSPATTLPITALLTPIPLTLRLPLWAGPSQDRQLFDTISLLIQGSLEGELKLMDELAGPGGQPSAFCPASSPGGSDPQVTVPMLCPLPWSCRAVPCCACFWGGGVFPAHWEPGERAAPWLQLSFGLGKRQPGVPQADINLRNA